MSRRQQPPQRSRRSGPRPRARGKPRARGDARTRSPQRRPAPRARPQPRRRRRLRRLALALLALPALVVVFVAGVAFTYAFANVPLPGDIGTRASVVLDAQGGELGTLEPQVGQREVAVGELPDHVILAVLAAEDAGFYEHRGVSFPGLVRAAVVNIVRGGVHQGGSTITQQYLKTVTADDEESLQRKVREAALAVKLEREHSKDEILGFYLNTIYFGRGAYGIGAAAEAYFDKPAAELSPEEAALLAGIVPAPSRLDPRDAPEDAERRYHYVVDRLLAEEWVRPEEAGRMRASMPETIAPHRLVDANAPWFLDKVREDLVRILGDEEQLYGGYTVTTTLDPRVQEAAEAAFAAHLVDTPPEVSGVIVALDPETGGIRALIGGKDRRASEFNAALRGTRQGGSTFKIFTLAAWIEQGNSPESIFDAPAQVTIDTPQGPWEPRNYGGQDHGETTVREATWRSVNTVFAQLSEAVTPEAQVDLAARAGLPAERLSAVPSFTLGTQAISPLELTTAVNAFPAGGIGRDTTSIERVERGGETVHEADPDGSRAFSEQVAWTVTDVLKGVLTSGTGRAADISRPAAGKTGTTQNSADAWFTGYTPDLTATVWMGHEDGNTAMAGDPTGGGLPAEAWATFMRTALEDVEPRDFPEPSGDLRLVEPTPTATPTPTAEPTPTCPEGHTLVEDPDAADGYRCEAPEPTPTPTPEPTEPPSPEPTPEPTPTAEPEPAPPTPTEPPADEPEGGTSQGSGAEDAPG